MPTFDDPTTLFDDPNFEFGGGIGDLIQQDYQFEYNGLLMGPGTVYRITSIDGLSLPDLRSADVDRPRDHGQLAGEDFFTGRDIVLTIIVKGLSGVDLFNQVEALARATEPGMEPMPLVYQLPGQIKKRSVVRPRRRKSTITYVEANAEIQTTTIQFHAIDPRLYDNALATVPLNLPGSSGGLGFTVGFPTGFGTATGGPTVITNSGNFPTRPLVVFLGPLTSPWIINDTTGEGLFTSFDLHGGDTLWIDFDYRTVLVNGVPSSLGGSRYSYVVAGSTWWQLEPGNSTVHIGADAGTGNATLQYRSAWI